jgi:hypothetical protein
LCSSILAFSGAPEAGTDHLMAWDDEEDWVGEPPEGRHSRDRAKPEFWRENWPVSVTGVGIVIALVILAIVLLS